MNHSGPLWRSSRPVKTLILIISLMKRHTRAYTRAFVSPPSINGHTLSPPTARSRGVSLSPQPPPAHKRISCVHFGCSSARSIHKLTRRRTFPPSFRPPLRPAAVIGTSIFPLSRKRASGVHRILLLAPRPLSASPPVRPGLSFAAVLFSDRERENTSLLSFSLSRWPLQPRPHVCAYT